MSATLLPEQAASEGARALQEKSQALEEAVAKSIASANERADAVLEDMNKSAAAAEKAVEEVMATSKKIDGIISKSIETLEGALRKYKKRGTQDENNPLVGEVESVDDGEKICDIAEPAFGDNVLASENGFKVLKGVMDLDDDIESDVLDGISGTPSASLPSLPPGTQPAKSQRYPKRSGAKGKQDSPGRIGTVKAISKGKGH